MKLKGTRNVGEKERVKLKGTRNVGEKERVKLEGTRNVGQKNPLQSSLKSRPMWVTLYFQNLIKNIKKRFNNENEMSF